MSSLHMGSNRFLQFEVPATELSAGTEIDLIAPEDGYIIGAAVVVQTAIVTGGDVTFKVGTTAVDGLTLTVANSAAKSSVVAEDKPTIANVTRKFTKGQRLGVVPAAAFNGGGALAGYIAYQSSGSPSVGG